MKELLSTLTRDYVDKLYEEFSGNEIEIGLYLSYVYLDNDRDPVVIHHIITVIRQINDLPSISYDDLKCKLKESSPCMNAK